MSECGLSRHRFLPSLCLVARHIVAEASSVVPGTVYPKAVWGVVFSPQGFLHVFVCYLQSSCTYTTIKLWPRYSNVSGSERRKFTGQIINKGFQAQEEQFLNPSRVGEIIYFI